MQIPEYYVKIGDKWFKQTDAEKVMREVSAFLTENDPIYKTNQKYTELMRSAEKALQEQQSEVDRRKTLCQATIARKKAEEESER